jgi:hypothetical protein
MGRVFFRVSSAAETGLRRPPTQSEKRAIPMQDPILQAASLMTRGRFPLPSRIVGINNDGKWGGFCSHKRGKGLLLYVFQTRRRLFQGHTRPLSRLGPFRLVDDSARPYHFNRNSQASECSCVIYSPSLLLRRSHSPFHSHIPSPPRYNPRAISGA